MPRVNTVPAGTSYASRLPSSMKKGNGAPNKAVWTTFGSLTRANRC